MPSSVWYANGKVIKDNIKYKYDSCGNICEITENGTLYVRYEYDALNRLVREDNKKFKKTWLYAYDKCGNITSKREFAFTLRDTDKLEELESIDNTYSYNGDRLTEFNGGTITYDSYGNPIIYKGETLEWCYGRLVKYGATLFTYDGFGRRTSKGGITFTYDRAGKLLKQTDGTNTLEFIYDNSGVCGFKYAGENYLYRKNAQGDISAILKASGSEVVRYDYDAWGNCDFSGDESLAELNPFRYRGYYFDTETGLYYLQTRYYDPEIGRFISQDNVKYLNTGYINGLNLYAYCKNNPVMHTDPNGTDAIYAVIYGIEGGVPIVGHAVLYFECNGIWYKTEFTGDNKADAKVILREMIDYSDVEADIDSYKPQNAWQYLLSEYLFYGISTIRFEGDYSACYDAAKNFEENGYGPYNLITNNCFHFVRDVLKVSADNSEGIKNYLDGTTQVAPSLAQVEMNIIQFLSRLFESN